MNFSFSFGCGHMGLNCQAEEKHVFYKMAMQFVLYSSSDKNDDCGNPYNESPKKLRQSKHSLPRKPDETSEESDLMPSPKKAKLCINKHKASQRKNKSIDNKHPVFVEKNLKR